MPRFGWEWLLAAGLTVLPLAALAADKPPRIFTPESKWNVNYADDVCRLGRVFVNDREKAILILDQFEPGSSFLVTAASPAFRGYAGRAIEVSFGPGGGSTQIDSLRDARYGDFGSAVMAGTIPLIESAPVEKTLASPATYRPPPQATPEQERAITWLEVRQGSRSSVRFELGPMHEVMKAMRACTDELLTHWDVDVEAHRTLTRLPVPTGSPGKWVSDEDYPQGLAERGVEGLIYFRLSVNEAGRVSGCSIQLSTRPAEFDKKVCDILSSRARFDPALDASERPIKSYWRSTFRFVIR